MFNIRVYGILFDEDQRILISDEFEHDMFFTKLPGGGLEQGEGTIDGLKREFMEECGLPVEVISHFYTTDFFVRSAFNDTQVISIYYLVKALAAPAFQVRVRPFDFQDKREVMQAFRWLKVSEIDPAMMTFPTEQHVITLLKKYIINFS